MSSFLHHQSSLPLARPFVVFLFFVALLPSPILANPDTSIRVLSVPLLADKQTTPQSVRLNTFSDGPIASSSCGFARVTQVGISVNKGARATLKYKIKIKAVTALQLSSSDGPFVKALSKEKVTRYIKLRAKYNGGLDVPFLGFLGVDLDDRSGKGKRDETLTDAEFEELSGVAQKILKSKTKQTIRVRGRLKAKGISCMRTTAFAFVKLAKVTLKSGDKLTVLTSKDEDVVAATRNADTVLPSSSGRLKLLDLD